jgi:hypothetical protein
MNRLTVERKSGTGHYVISAFVVDENDLEFLHSIQFWGYDEEDFEDHSDMMNALKQAYRDLLKKDNLVLS